MFVRLTLLFTEMPIRLPRIQGEKQELCGDTAPPELQTNRHQARRSPRKKMFSPADSDWIQTHFKAW